MLELVVYPNKILKTRCNFVSVPRILEIKPLLESMFSLMRDKNGIGLAANQVGLLDGFFILEIAGRKKTYFNPRIQHRSDELVVSLEGCLSFPNKQCRVKRACAIAVTYTDENLLEVHEDIIDPLWAIAFQHESDHLWGKTMFDRQFTGRLPKTRKGI